MGRTSGESESFVLGCVGGLRGEKTGRVSLAARGGSGGVGERIWVRAELDSSLQGGLGEARHLSCTLVFG